MEELNDAFDRCHAAKGRPSAIIATLMVAICDNGEVTDLAVNRSTGLVFSGRVS